MMSFLVIALLTLVLSLSARFYLLVVVAFGSVLVSKFQFMFDLTDFEGNMMRNIATNIGGGVHILKGLAFGRPYAIPQEIKPYLYLSALSIIGLFFSIDLKEGMRFISILTIPLLVFFVSVMYLTREDYISVLKALVVVFFLQLIAGAVEYALSPGIRVSGLHDVPAVYGWFVSIALIVYTYLTVIDRGSRGVLFVFLGTGSILLILTGGRIAMLIFPFTLFYLVTETKVSKRVVAPILVMLAVVVILLFSYQIEQGTARIGFTGGSIENVEFEGEAGGTFTWRLLLWERLLSGWVEKPLLGYGPGGDYAVSLQGGLTSDVNYAQSGPVNTHNEYIKLLFNHGIIGLVFFLVFAYRLIRMKRLLQSAEQFVVARVIFFMTVSWLIFSLTDNGLSYHGQTSVLFFLLAYHTNLGSLQNQQ